MAAIPAAYWIMAAGTAAKMMGDRQQQKQQRSIINRALDQTGKVQGATQQMIGEEGAKYAGEARNTALQGQEDAAYAQAQKDVQGATLPQATSGRQSADYLKAQASKTASEGDRLTAIAREAAAVRSPGRLLQEEGMRGADLQGRVGSMLGSDANMARAAATDASAVQAPMYGQLGGLAASLASMYAAGGMGGAGGATSYALPAGAQLGQNASNASLFSPAKTYLNPGGARIRFGGA
jgi:hypothetical protein